jgi:hypothetical protein
MAHGIGWLWCSLWYTSTTLAAVYASIHPLLHLSWHHNNHQLTFEIIQDLGWTFTAADTLFSISAVIFLLLSSRYGHHYAPNATPYSGAFHLHSRNFFSNGEKRDKKYPTGFHTYYIPFALFISLISPALTSALACTYAAARWEIIYVCFAGYFIVFIVQIALETRFLNRNHMTSSIPFTFGLYRFWQLSRTLLTHGIIIMDENVMGRVHSTITSHQHDMDALGLNMIWMNVLVLLVFWIFDHAVTATLLPWMMNVHLLTKDA